MRIKERTDFALLGLALLATATAACSDAEEVTEPADMGMSDVLEDAQTDMGADADVDTEAPFGCETCAVFVGKYFDGARFVNGAVAIDGDTIHAATDSLPEEVAGTRRDITGTLIPGLFDLHTHMTANGAVDAVSFPTTPTAMRALLRAGVTTTLDLGTAGPIAFEFRRRVNEGRQIGPRLLVTGPLVTTDGGHPCGHSPPWEFCIFVDEPSHVARLDPLLAESPDLVKVVLEAGFSEHAPSRDRLDAGLLGSIVSAVAPTRTIAHVGGRQDVADALDAGVRLFGHVPTEDLLEGSDITNLLEKDAAVVPTLVVSANLEALAAGTKRFLEGVDESDVHPELIASFDNEQLSFPDWYRPAIEQLVDNGRTNFVALHQAGVKIAAGTDAGNPATMHGPSLWAELAIYVDLGMSTSEALASATSVAADVLEVPGGRLAAGEPADLVFVAGDIEADIHALRDITAVYKAGVQQDLDALAGTSQDFGEVDPPRDGGVGGPCFTRNECAEGLACSFLQLECRPACSFFERCDGADEVCVGALGGAGACLAGQACDPFADDCEYGACLAMVGTTWCGGYGEGGEGDDCSKGCLPGYQCDTRNNRCAQLCDLSGNMSTCPDGQTCTDIGYNNTENLGYCAA